MYLVQELYYISRGVYVRRKSLTVVYEITNHGVIPKDVIEGEHSNIMRDLYAQYGRVFNILPAIETTPSRYKDFLHMKKSMTRK